MFQCTDMKMRLFREKEYFIYINYKDLRHITSPFWSLNVNLYKPKPKIEIVVHTLNLTQ